jgi:threonine dehydrogenase-like Zn-dependent dehydrogenase
MAGDHQQALDAVEHGVFNPRRMILHVLPQKEIGRGFELL